MTGARRADVPTPRPLRTRGTCWIAAGLVLAVVLAPRPLFGVVGYEHALALSLFASLAGLDLGAAWGRYLAPPAAPHRWLGRALGWLVATLAPGVALGVVAAAWQPVCDWPFALLAVLALPAATVVICGAAGAALGVATGPRRWLGPLAPPLAWLALATWGVARFYGEPPVFTYHPFVGFFPGNLYDERIDLGAALAWSRLEQALAVTGVLIALLAARSATTGRPALATLRGRWPWAGASGVALALAVLLRSQGGTLGHAVDADDIAAALGGRVETAHFVIHHARTPGIEAELPAIVADHEFRLAQVIERLGVRPSGKITSYYFANDDEKARWTGARRVEMAKPWRREIYLTHAPFPHPSLRHELAHVVAAELGDPIFGVAAGRVLGLPLAFNPGLIEGLAVAVDWPGNYDAELTPDEAVRAMQAQGVAPSVRRLFSLQFLAVASARGYATAGSFIHYLWTTRGNAPLGRVYGLGGDFAAAYGEPLETLEAGWRSHLESLPLPEGAVEATRERFRRGALFDRPCPHAVAARDAQVAERLADDDLAGAIALQRQTCVDQPGEPQHRLDLAKLLARAPGGEAEALTLWSQAAGDPTASSTLRAEALGALARLAVARGDRTQAADHLAAARALALPDGVARTLEAQAVALAHPGPAADLLRAYFWADDVDALALAEAMVAVEPALALGHYLLGLRRLEARQPAGAADALARALALGLPSVRFRRQAARRLAIAAYRADDAARLDAAIEALRAPDLRAIDALLADDWAARRAFDAAATSR